MFQIGIIIPSKNEFNSLKKIIIELKKKKLNFVVIDDGSNDKTREYLTNKKINHLRNKKSIGYTKSIIKGINFYKKRKNVKYILTMDADGEHNLKYLKNFLNKLKQKEYDLIIANRRYKNRISENIVSFICKIKYNIEDPLSGFKLYKSNTIFKNSKFFNKKNFLVDYSANLIKKKFLITNINIDNSKILNRKSRIGNNILVNFKILFLVRYFF